MLTASILMDAKLARHVVSMSVVRDDQGEMPALGYHWMALIDVALAIRRAGVRMDVSDHDASLLLTNPPDIIHPRSIEYNDALEAVRIDCVVR